jgi:hypothetical protein
VARACNLWAGQDAKRVRRVRVVSGVRSRLQCSLRSAVWVGRRWLRFSTTAVLAPPVRPRLPHHRLAQPKRTRVMHHHTARVDLRTRLSTRDASAQLIGGASTTDPAHRDHQHGRGPRSSAVAASEQAGVVKRVIEGPGGSAVRRLVGRDGRTVRLAPRVCDTSARQSRTVGLHSAIESCFRPPVPNSTSVPP